MGDQIEGAGESQVAQVPVPVPPAAGPGVEEPEIVEDERAEGLEAQTKGAFKKSCGEGGLEKTRRAFKVDSGIPSKTTGLYTETEQNSKVYRKKYTLGGRTYH